MKSPEICEVPKDDTFGFIAGYTSNGVPFGFTHEEFEKIMQNDYIIEKQFDELFCEQILRNANRLDVLIPDRT